MHPQAYTRLQKDGLRMKADDDAAAEAPRRPSVPSEPKQGPAPRPRAESGGGGGAGDASVAVRAAHAAAAAERREDAAVAVTAAARGGGTHRVVPPGLEETPGGCGSCYGAAEDGVCCDTCGDVMRAYRKKGWTFGDHGELMEGFAQVPSG